jgi:hypothetical protein
MVIEPFITLGISLGLGLLIGLQWERTEGRFGGIRTFPLISVFGTFCGLLALDYGAWPIGAGLIAIFGTLAIADWATAREQKSEHGQTTEIAALLTFAIAFFAAAITGGLLLIWLWPKGWAFATQ